MTFVKKFSDSRFWLIVFALLNLASCSSYMIRKECEKLNWYQVGYDAAMRGDRISNDDQVSRCRKADAEMSESQLDVGFKAGMSKYCQPDTVFQTGKNGDLFNTDFCDSGQNSMLRARHDKGIQAYCQASNGVNAGTSGHKYKNVCSQDQEASFLPQYKIGRKRYLNGMIRNSETKLSETQRDISNLNEQKRRLDTQISLMPYAKSGEGDPYSARRNDLQNQSWQIGSQISSKELQKDKLQKELDELKSELITVD
jgi:chaperonin cofactor prefoldin